MKNINIYTLVIILFLLQTLRAENILTFEEIHDRVKNSNPEFKIIEMQGEIAESNIKQASKLPNPEFEMELENLGKNEIGVGLSQTFELGGKRGVRIELAELEKEMLEHERNLKELEMEVEIITRVIPILALYEEIKTIDSFIIASEKTLEMIKKRVEIGASMPIDETRATVDLNEIKLEKKLALNELEQLKNDLAQLWLGSSDDFNKIGESLLDEISIPSLETFYKSYENHPESKLQILERKISKLELKDTKKSVIPDISVGAGVVRNNEEKENAYILSFGLELPVFNKNRDEIKAVTIGNEVLNTEISAAVYDVKSEIRALYSEFLTISEELVVVKKQILPGMLNILETLMNHYLNGSVSLLEVIETQSELLETKSRILELNNTRAEICNELYLISGYKTAIFYDK